MLKNLIDRMKSQETKRPEKGDIVSIDGITDNLWIVTDVTDKDTICRVTSVRKMDDVDKVIPFFQIMTNWSTSCK